MSGYILCQTKKAATPYFIENIRTNIYSLEELCYYFYHNLYLIDQSIMNEGLCSWLEEELELPKLAAKIRPNLGKFVSAEDVLYPVFKEINYLTYEELRVLNGKLQKMDQELPLVRQKQKGDALIENGMYVNAIHVYQELLEREDCAEAPEGVLERVYYNMGCAYSYLFLMEKAMEYFWKAYECRKSENALKSFCLAYKTVRTKKMETLQVPDEVKTEVQKALQEFAKLPEQSYDKEKINLLLAQMTKEYHKSTGS